MLTLIGPDRPLRFAAHRQPLCWNFMYHSRIVLSVGGSVRYMVRNLRCIVTIDSVFGKFQDTERFLIHCARHFSSRLLPSGGTCKYAKDPSTKKSFERFCTYWYVLSALSFLVVAQSSSEVPEGLMNNPVFLRLIDLCLLSWHVACCRTWKCSE